jgi:hypothetical protein
VHLGSPWVSPENQPIYRSRENARSIPARRIGPRVEARNRTRRGPPGSSIPSRPWRFLDRSAARLAFARLEIFLFHRWSSLAPSAQVGSHIIQNIFVYWQCLAKEIEDVGYGLGFLIHRSWSSKPWVEEHSDQPTFRSLRSFRRHTPAFGLVRLHPWLLVRPGTLERCFSAGDGTLLDPVGSTARRSAAVDSARNLKRRIQLGAPQGSG